MRRFRVAAAACAVTVAVAAVGLTAVSGPAAAGTAVTTGATAASLPAFTGSGTVITSIGLNGAIGGLLDGLISPIINQDLTPLATALQSMTVNSLVTATLGANGPYVAGTPSQQTTPGPATFPNDTMPAGCSATVGVPCYNATSGLSPNLGTLTSLSLASVSGWTQQVASSADATNPIYGRASVAAPSVSVLPSITSITNPVVKASSAGAKANCPNDGSAPSAMETGSGISLFGGLVTFDIVNGGDVGNLKVNGTSYTSLSVMPTVTVGSVTVAPFGAASVKLTIPLSASDLINALGLPASTVTDLLSYAVSSSMVLNVTAGPNDNVTTSAASAWGLGIGLDLSGALNFNLQGLAGATVAIPTGMTGGNYGNVLDARLGYTSCTEGLAPSGGGTGTGTTGYTGTPVPPALI